MIGSLRHAMMVIGRRQLERWRQLLMYTLAGGGAIRYPGPLAILAATRSRLLERLAAALGLDGQAHSDRAFMVGVLSLAGALLSRDLHEIVGPLPLGADAKQGLLERAGPLGELLDLAEALERAEVGKVAGVRAADLQALDQARVNAAWLDAMSWGQSPATEKH